MIAWLNGHSLTVKDRFRAERMALNLSERQSTATITVGPEAPEIGVDNWLKDESEPGAGIVWRVKSVDMNYDTQTRTINCEHVINTLKDRIMFGEVTPATITGNKKATTCTASQAIRYILNRQSDWTLDKLDYGNSEEFSFNGDDLFSALETVSSSFSDPWWSYDLSSYPFKLSIRKHDRETVGCEMRMDRNIRTLRRTIDRSRMFTRHYPIGENDLHISGDYVSKNESLYGTVCKVETDSAKKTESALRNWANDRLARHAEPAVTITISGLDLSAATGEPLDRLTLGKVCRVPLPEYSTTISEWITKLSWSDKLADPESVSVTLANTLEDVASIVNKISKSNASSGRKSAKKQKEDHAWFVDTEDHVGMIAEAVAGPGAATNWSRVSSVIVDGLGIHQQVQRTVDDVVDAVSRIDMNEESISLVVEGKGKDGKIKAASIVTSINNAGSSICISADHIKLDGNTRLNNVLSIADGMARFNRPVAFGVNAGQRASISLGIVSAPQFHWDGNAANQYYCTAADFGGMIKTAEVTNNTLKLTKWNKEVLTFSKATTLSSAWSGGVITVTASPQGTALQESLIQKSATWAANKKSATIPIHTTWGSSGQYESDTGWSVYIDASTAYNEGAARALDSISEAYTTAPNGATYDGNTNNSDGYFTSGSGRGKTVGIVVKAELKDGNTVLKTLYNDLISAPTNIYKHGWDCAADKIEWPATISGSTTKSYFDFTYPTTSGSSSIRFTLSKDSGGAYLKIGTALKLRVT